MNALFALSQANRAQNQVAISALLFLNTRNTEKALTVYSIHQVKRKKLSCFLCFQLLNNCDMIVCKSKQLNLDQSSRIITCQVLVSSNVSCQMKRGGLCYESLFHLSVLSPP